MLRRVYVLTLIFPHSITSNLAFPDQVYQQGACFLRQLTSPLCALQCAHMAQSHDRASSQGRLSFEAFHHFQRLRMSDPPLGDALQTIYIQCCLLQGSRRHQSGS